MARGGTYMEKLRWAMVIVASMVVGGAAVVGINTLDSDNGGPTTVIERVQPSSQGGVSNNSASTVADLYDEVRPSVVRINASNGTNAGGLGSGIVLDKEGHILTNYHVVGGFPNIDVQLGDGTSATARVVGTDQGNDLAVIKADLPADKLTPAKLGDSDNIRVGELVIAIGNPFDLEGSVTEGIVSGIGRSLNETGGRPLRELIQTDAAINPGNSGGALFNGKGEVIGITTAIENPSGNRVFVGIGYSVPINIATRFLPQMLAGQNVQHPRLGISLRDVTPSLTASLNLSVDRGVLVQTVEPGSAAERAGLRGTRSADTAGDVIVAIDSAEIKSFEDLARYIDTKEVGDTVQLRVMRGGSETTLSITLEAWRSG
jgi:S1-C subfamily serine protease